MIEVMYFGQSDFGSSYHQSNPMQFTLETRGNQIYHGLSERNSVNLDQASFIKSSAIINDNPEDERAS